MSDCRPAGPEASVYLEAGREPEIASVYLEAGKGVRDSICLPGGRKGSQR